MDKINQILNNKKYKSYLKKLIDLEEDREFCKHNIEHFLDTARISYIQVLENKLDYSKEIVYGVALLHDIGRVEQYINNIPHDIASVKIAKEILSETDYSTDEVEKILLCISNHRNENQDELSKIFYKSDKLSRNCFSCNAEDKCYWQNSKKNFSITY